MGRRATNQMEAGAVADFIRDAAVRLGIPEERLNIAVRASKELSREEFEVISALVEFARSGASMKRRSALSRGIKRAIETFSTGKVEEESPPDQVALAAPP